MKGILAMNEFFSFRSDPENMNENELHSYLISLRARIAELDESEPSDMNSDAYEEWGQRHEELEDLVDDVLDCLDNLGN